MTIQSIRNFASKQFKDIKTYGIRELFRKFYLLVKHLVRIPIVIIGILPCVMIRLVKPWILIRIAGVGCSNFGNFVNDAGVYYIKKKLNINQPKKKHLDLFYIPQSEKIYNRQLAKMWKRKIKFLPNYFLEPIDLANRLIPGWKAHTIVTFSSQRERDVGNLIEKYQPLNFTPDEEMHGKEMLKKFGLNDGDKFVCLSVRDAAYQLKKIPSRFRDWSYQEFRNFNINDFVKAAESLAERGYYVFRMGVVVEKALNSKNPKIIDYANSELRSDFMDIYLAAKCSFALSTGGGYWPILYFFRRPIAFLHFIPLGDFPSFSDKFFIMAKNHVLKKEKKKMSLSEIFSQGAAFAFDSKFFKEKGIELIDYSPEEIKDFALEMVENLELKKKLSSEDEELQNKFKSLYLLNLKKNIKLNAGRKHDDIPKIHGEIKFRLSPRFLRENKNWLS